MRRRPPPTERRARALAELLLERHGVADARARPAPRASPGGFAALYDALAALETLGACRRGYFVEGLGGAQFALPGGGRAPARARDASAAEAAIVLAATDPAQPYGAALRLAGGAPAHAGPPAPAPTSCSSAAARV